MCRPDRRPRRQARDERRRPRHRALRRRRRRTARPSPSATTAPRRCPGFGVARIYTDQQFSLVITDTDSRRAGGLRRHPRTGCRPVRRGRRGGGATAAGRVERRPRASRPSSGPGSQRELDITPTRARILLSDRHRSAVPDDVAEGFDGYIQGGRATRRPDDLRAELKSDGDHDVAPFARRVRRIGRTGHGRLLRRGRGARLRPGRRLHRPGLLAGHHRHRTATPVACGDILEPDDDEFAEAGLALVQLLPTGDDGVQGFALIDRRGMQRELDVTPTLVRIVLFAPPPPSRPTIQGARA